MELKLDDATLQEAMNKALLTAVSQSIQSWDIEKRLKEGATTALMAASVDTVVANALAQTDMIALTAAVSKEITKSVTSLACNALRETMVKVVFELRKGGKYYTSDDEFKELAIIRAELNKN